MEPRHTTGFAGGLVLPPVAGPLLPMDSLGADSLTATVAEYRVEETARPINAKKPPASLVDSGEHGASRPLRVPEAQRRDHDGHDRDRLRRLATALASELDADFLALLQPRAASSIGLHAAQSAVGAAFLLRSNAPASGPMNGDARGQAAFFAGYRGNEDLSWAFAPNRAGEGARGGRDHNHRPHRPNRHDGGQTVAALEDPPGNPPGGPPPIPPAAQPDSYYAVYNTQLSVPAAGVLTNDAGSPLTAVLDSQPTFGAVNLNANGSFIYTPPSNQEGVATFTYHAHNGQQSSNVTTVTITVWRPKVDIDVDSNNNGSIDPLDGPSGTDDPIEENAPGVYVPVNDDDDNGNEVHDWAEAPSVGGNGQTLWDDELVRANLELELQAGLNLSGFTVQLSVSSGFKIWDTAYKQNNLTNAAFTLSSGSGGLPQYVYLEALQSGLATLTATLQNPQGGQVHQDTAKASGITVDLDIDSDNDDGLGTPERSADEDVIEYDFPKVGKQIIANLGDKDADGVPDYADGFNVDGQAGNADDENVREKFVPLVLNVPEPIDLTKAKFLFDYPASDPSAVAPVNGVYPPPSSFLRIWTKDGNVARNMASVTDASPGDFVPDGVQIVLPEQIGLSNVNRTVTLYVEATGPASSTPGNVAIGVLLDPDRFMGEEFTSDYLRLTVVDVAFVADGGQQYVIDQTDPRIDHADIGHWGADTQFPQGAAGGEGPGLSGYNDDGTLKNTSLFAENFIYQDPDRFHIRVTDPSRNLDPQVAEWFYVNVGTLTESFATDDDLTQIVVRETGVNTGVFASLSQLLMSPDLPSADHPDDDFEVHNGWSDGGPVADDAPGDRTHRSSIDGSIRVEDGSLITGIPVFDRNPEERRILTMRATVFVEPFEDTNGDGHRNALESYVDINLDGVWNTVLGSVSDATDYVNAQVERANIAWAQAGIKVELAGSIIFKQAPSVGNVNVLADRVFDVVEDASVVDDAKVVIGATTATHDIVEVFFVCEMFAGADALSGVAVIPAIASLFPAIGENSFVFVGRNTQLHTNTDLRNRTLAHEIGHVLTNQGDVNQPHHVYYPATITLRDTQSMGSGAAEAFSYRRIQHATEAQARTVRAQGDGGGVGNRLLTEP